MRVGRTFFALALIGLGAEHFIFGEFVTGRAPGWPTSIPGRVMWAYTSGFTVVWAGAMLLLGKRARSAALVAAAVIGVWALVRHLPVLAAEAFLSGAWTRGGKALALTGGALAIAATMPPLNAARSPLVTVMNLRGEFVLAGRLCLGVFLAITGIQHFLVTEFVASLIPHWFPGHPIFWTYFAGVALIAGGIGLFVSFTARLAALLSGVMVFSWFWIIHLPRTFLGISDSIAVFEALAVSGVALTLAGCLSDMRLQQRAHASRR